MHEFVNYSHERRSSREDDTTDISMTVSRESSSDVPAVVRRLVHEHNLDHLVDELNKAYALLQGDQPQGQITGITDLEVAALEKEINNRWRQPKTLYFTIVICSVGAIVQGWAQTSMNGANLYFPLAFGIDSDSSHDKFVVGLINCGMYLSTGLVGAWSSDPINNMGGRRGALAVGAALCCLANLGSALSQSWPQLLAFRVVLGLGAGIVASTASVYAAECAPATIRGGLAVSWQMWVAFGIFMGFVANVLVYNYGPDAWRLQLGAAAIPTLPLLAMVYACPESPSWLRNTNLQAARDLLSAYLQQGAQSKSASEKQVPFIRKVVQLVTIPRNRRATTASYVLMLSQQLCGINIIAFYSSTIFTESGFTTFGALLSSCVFGLVNFLGAFPAVWTMDTLGRRSLLLLTLPFMAMTMFAAGLSFYIPNENPAHLVLIATMIYLFCAEYSPGMGPVPSSYSAEAFPLSHREVGMSLGVATANIWAAVLSLTFPRLLSAWGSQATFGLYALLNVVALILVFLFVPETRLKTLEELDEVFSISTRSFIKYHVTQWLPWMTRRYVLRQRNAVLMPFTASESGYTEIEQDETD